VLPERATVIAITANARDMQGAFNVVWDKLLPAIGEAPSAEDADEQAKLESVIQGLEKSR
jgi:hypothetical protein